MYVLLYGKVYQGNVRLLASSGWVKFKKTEYGNYEMNNTDVIIVTLRHS